MRAAGNRCLHHSTEEWRLPTMYASVLWGLVQFGLIPFLSISCYVSMLLLWRSADHLLTHRLFVYPPDEPPALQVLLDDLHGDPFLKGDFILPLTGVRLYRHIFLLWRSRGVKGKRERGAMWVKCYHFTVLHWGVKPLYSLYLPKRPCECDLLKMLWLIPYQHKYNPLPLVLH